MRFFFLFSFFVMIMACNTNRDADSYKNISFDKQGHRGCRGLMPENTIPAMLKAIYLGMTTLEMDVVITKDSQVLVSHEPFFSSEITTKPDGSFINKDDELQYNIFQMDYEEVIKYDVGLKTHPRFPEQHKIAAVKPLLSDLIDAVEDYISQKKLPPVYYNIETKSRPEADNIYHPTPEVFVDLIMKVIKEKGIENRVIIQSFDVRTLKVVKKSYPEIMIALLVEEKETNPVNYFLTKLGFIPNIFSPHYSMVNKESFIYCKQKGMKIIPWTVNDKDEIKRLREIGVDGIITDYPNLLNEEK